MFALVRPSSIWVFLVVVLVTLKEIRGQPEVQQDLQDLRDLQEQAEKRSSRRQDAFKEMMKLMNDMEIRKRSSRRQEAMEDMMKLMSDFEIKKKRSSRRQEAFEEMMRLMQELEDKKGKRIFGSRLGKRSLWSDWFGPARVPQRVHVNDKDMIVTKIHVKDLPWQTPEQSQKDKELFRL